jgi:hypothetical protein
MLNDRGRGIGRKINDQFAVALKGVDMVEGEKGVGFVYALSPYLEIVVSDCSASFSSIASASSHQAIAA